MTYGHEVSVTVRYQIAWRIAPRREVERRAAASRTSNGGRNHALPRLRPLRCQPFLGPCARRPPHLGLPALQHGQWQMSRPHAGRTIVAEVVRPTALLNLAGGRGADARHVHPPRLGG